MYITIYKKIIITVKEKGDLVNIMRRHKDSYKLIKPEAEVQAEEFFSKI